MTHSEAIFSDPKDAPIYEAQKSLKRVKTFNPKTLVQSARLGEYNFEKAVSPAQKIIALIKEAPADAIYALPKINSAPYNPQLMYLTATSMKS